MEKAQVIASLISEAGLSNRAFAAKIGLPATTLQSMLTRGVGGAAIDNVIKVCKGLGITIDKLEEMAEKIYGIGWAIRDKRVRLGLARQELSRSVGIDGHTLLLVELGQTSISKYFAERIIVNGFSMPFLSFLSEYDLFYYFPGLCLGRDTDTYKAAKKSVHKPDCLSENFTIHTQHDDGDWTKAELKIIDQFKEFLISLRDKA